MGLGATHRMHPPRVGPDGTALSEIADNCEVIWFHLRLLRCLLLVGFVISRTTFLWESRSLEDHWGHLMYFWVNRKLFFPNRVLPVNCLYEINSFEWPWKHNQIKISFALCERTDVLQCQAEVSLATTLLYAYRPWFLEKSAEHFLMVTIVKSTCGGFERRKKIRNAWGAITTINGKRLVETHVFLW